jgi:uncharacterized protein (DUF433 family)
MENLISRITINPEVCGGRPSIRNMRFTVAQILELVSSRMTFEEILSDYPFLEKQDLQACLLYSL